MGVLYKSLSKMLLIDDIDTKEATNKSRFVCVPVFFFLVFCMFSRPFMSPMLLVLPML